MTAVIWFSLTSGNLSAFGPNAGCFLTKRRAISKYRKWKVWNVAYSENIVQFQISSNLLCEFCTLKQEAEVDLKMHGGLQSDLWCKCDPLTKEKRMRTVIG